MSIQSEITRISGNVSDALDAIEDKGVTIPSGANSDDLADLIAQITGGGGVGGITQDEDGYLVLSPDAPSPTPSGGLEFETGAWSPVSDTATATISFSNVHSTPPMAAYMYDSNPSTMDSSATSYFGCVTTNISNFVDNISSAVYPFYGVTRRQYTGGSGSTASLSNTTTVSDYVTTAEYKPQGTYATAYWRAGRTYKWIAVWAPTT